MEGSPACVNLKLEQSCSDMLMASECYSTSPSASASNPQYRRYTPTFSNGYDDYSASPLYGSYTQTPFKPHRFDSYDGISAEDIWDLDSNTVKRYHVLEDDLRSSNHPSSLPPLPYDYPYGNSYNSYYPSSEGIYESGVMESWTPTSGPLPKSETGKKPKSYQCEPCDKWFTSSGHLKRHYNTTLHRNAIRSKGVTLRSPSHVDSTHCLSEGVYSENSNEDRSEGNNPSPVSSSSNTQHNTLHNTHHHTTTNNNSNSNHHHHSNHQSNNNNNTITSSASAQSSSSSSSSSLAPLSSSYYSESCSSPLIASSESPSLEPSSPSSERLKVQKSLFSAYETSTGASSYVNYPLSSYSETYSSVPSGPLSSSSSNTSQYYGTYYSQNSSFSNGAHSNAPVSYSSYAYEFSGKSSKLTIQSSEDGSDVLSETTLGDFRCSDCNKSFNKICYLKQHNKTFHNGEKPYKCSQCGKRFPVDSLYQEHLAKHAGDKPYKCEVCPKQFNHKTDLRRHMCLHTGEKPFSCDVCGKGFIREDRMIKHSDTHKKKH